MMPTFTGPERVTARTLLTAFGITSAAALVACHIGSGYRVGGVVTGLRGSGLVIQDNSGNSLTVTANGGFQFSSGIDKGGTYSVTVSTQPSKPSQTCIVHNGSGTIDNADITNVIVACNRAGLVAYAVNQGSNSISGYAIASSGALVPLSGSPYAATGTTPVAAVVDPDGVYLYVVNNASNTLSIFAIDPATGALSSASEPVPTGNGPFAVLVDPANQFVYVANKTDDTVSVYQIQNGTALAVSGSPYAVGREPTSLAMDPGGNFLYVTNYADGTVSAFSVEAGAGLLTPLGGSPFGAAQGALRIAIDPTGSLAYVANEVSHNLSGYSLNPSTGTLSALSGFPLATTTSPEAIAFDPGGRFALVANVTATNDVASYVIAPSTGALTLSGTANTGNFPLDIALTPSGAYAYIADELSGTLSGYSVDATTGALTAVPGSPFAAGADPRSIAID